jgi:hypothetical protein
MGEESIKRFANYSTHELESLLREMQGRYRLVLPVFIAEIRVELQRRARPRRSTGKDGDRSPAA